MYQANNENNTTDESTPKPAFSPEFHSIPWAEEEPTVDAPTSMMQRSGHLERSR